jgi:zinc/manganese transport system ATP-binding protein
MSPLAHYGFLLLARELVAFGPTGEVMTETLLARARQLSEAFDEHAGKCSLPEPA